MTEVAPINEQSWTEAHALVARRRRELAEWQTELTRKRKSIPCRDNPIDEIETWAREFVAHLDAEPSVIDRLPKFGPGDKVQARSPLSGEWSITTPVVCKVEWDSVIGEWIYRMWWTVGDRVGDHVACESSMRRAQ